MEDPDVNVEVENEFQEEPAGTGPGPKVLINETPNLVLQSYETVLQFLSAYGWFIVVGLIAVFFIKSKLEPYINKARKKREEQQEYTSFDPQKTQTRQEAMDAARMRLQEKHAADAERFAEKQKQKEEEKRKQKIEEWEKHKKGEGYRSKYRPAEEEDNASGSAIPPGSRRPRYRPSDYNPLTGAGSGGSGYRPPTRGGGGGGG